MSDTPTIPYWHLWTDSDGINRQARCEMTDFQLKSMKPPAAPQWQGEKTSGGMSVIVTVQPVGWSGTWHENPKPQWIIPLSGRWYVESMDGQRVEMGAGEISFGGDQNCSTIDRKTGHMSGTIGDAPAVLMVVQFDGDTAPRPPCSFR